MKNKEKYIELYNARNNKVYILSTKDIQVVEKSIDYEVEYETPFAIWIRLNNCDRWVCIYYDTKHALEEAYMHIKEELGL